MSKTEARFIQITSTTAGTLDGIPCVVLHALDEYGNVWEYVAEAEHWVSVPTDKS